MNFKNIENYLKKNYKFIIIICLFLFLIMDNKENFTTAQALDGVKETEKKVNDIFYSIDKDWVRSKKGIYSQKEIKSVGNIMSAGDVKSGNGKVNIGKNGTVYADRLNLKHNIEKVENINSSGDVKGKRFCIGETCVDENHLKILSGKRHLWIQSGRGGHLSDRGGWKGQDGTWEKMYLRVGKN